VCGGLVTDRIRGVKKRTRQDREVRVEARRSFSPARRRVGAPRAEADALPAGSNATGLLLIERVEPYEEVAWHLVSDRLHVRVRLLAADADRTVATVTIEGPWRPEVLGRPRRLPREALNRPHALCQTAASF
jgi:hypothetical protein